jgi:hypothetical protein
MNEKKRKKEISLLLIIIFNIATIFASKELLSDADMRGDDGDEIC